MAHQFRHTRPRPRYQLNQAQAPQGYVLAYEANQDDQNGMLNPMPDGSYSKTFIIHGTRGSWTVSQKVHANGLPYSIGGGYSVGPTTWIPSEYNGYKMINDDQYAPDWMMRKTVLIKVIDEDAEQDPNYHGTTLPQFEANKTLGDLTQWLNDNNAALPGDTSEGINKKVKELQDAGEVGKPGVGDVEPLIDIGVKNPFALDTGTLFKIDLFNKPWLWYAVTGFCLFKLTQEKSNKIIWTPATIGAGFLAYQTTKRS